MCGHIARTRQQLWEEALLPGRSSAWAAPWAARGGKGDCRRRRCDGVRTPRQGLAAGGATYLAPVGRWTQEASVQCSSRRGDQVMSPAWVQGHAAETDRAVVYPYSERAP